VCVNVCVVLCVRLGGAGLCACYVCLNTHEQTLPPYMKKWLNSNASLLWSNFRGKGSLNLSGRSRTAATESRLFLIPRKNWGFLLTLDSSVSFSLSLFSKQQPVPKIRVPRLYYICDSVCVHTHTHTQSRQCYKAVMPIVTVQLWLKV
jgi:hypothetical protein